MSGYKRLLFGEAMPDKDDPKYKDRYVNEVKAGRRFAQKLRLDKAAAAVQHFANAHRRLFLSMVFSFIAFCFLFNVYRMVVVATHKPTGVAATEYQEELLRKRHERISKTITQKNQPINQESNGNISED